MKIKCFFIVASALLVLAGCTHSNNTFNSLDFPAEQTLQDDEIYAFSVKSTDIEFDFDSNSDEHTQPPPTYNDNYTYSDNSTDDIAVSTTVWVTKTGKKYHLIPDCSNMKKPETIQLSEAMQRGYEACKKCCK